MMRARSSPRCSVSSSRFSSSRGGRLGRLSSGLAATATGHHTLLTATTSQQYRQSYAPESTRASQYYTTVTPPPFCCVLPRDCLLLLELRYGNGFERDLAGPISGVAAAVPAGRHACGHTARCARAGC